MGRSIAQFEAEQAEFSRVFGRAPSSRGVLVPLMLAEFARVRRLVWITTYRATREEVHAKPSQSGVRQRWESALQALSDSTDFVGNLPAGPMTADQCEAYWDAVARAALELDSLDIVPDWDAVALDAAEEAVSEAVSGAGDVLKFAAAAFFAVALLLIVRR